MNEQKQAISTVDLIANEVSSSSTNISTAQPDNTNAVHEEQGIGYFLTRCLQPFREFPSKLRQKFIDDSEENDVSLKVIIARWFSSTLVWIICLVVAIILPLIVAIYGLVNLNSCSTKPTLPFFLFALGFIMTFSNLFNLAMSLDLPILNNHNLLTNELKNVIASLVNVLLNCAAAFYFVLVTAVVFLKGSNDEYCTVQPFAFGFVITTISSILLISGGVFAYNLYTKSETSELKQGSPA